MELIIEKNYAYMSRKAAKIIAGEVKRNPGCVLGLATGSTPLGTYRQLIKEYEKGMLDFSQVQTFNLDEYCGIAMDLSKPYQQDQTYARFMHEELFKHINLAPEHIHIPRGLAEDAEQHSIGYEQAIKDAGGIDLQLLGLGGNGHLAFNEPGSSLASRTRRISLAQKTIDDNYEKFYKNAGIGKEHMPQSAITMGIGTILETQKALMLVSGKSKAAIVKEAVEGCITARVPASALQLHPGRVTVILDQEAASQLTWSLDLAKQSN